MTETYLKLKVRNKFDEIQKDLADEQWISIEPTKPTKPTKTLIESATEQLNFSYTFSEEFSSIMDNCNECKKDRE